MCRNPVGDGAKRVTTLPETLLAEELIVALMRVSSNAENAGSAGRGRRNVSGWLAEGLRPFKPAATL
jgi:hypothetical protein